MAPSEIRVICEQSCKLFFILKRCGSCNPFFPFSPSPRARQRCEEEAGGGRGPRVLFSTLKKFPNDGDSFFQKGKKKKKEISEGESALVAKIGTRVLRLTANLTIYVDIQFTLTPALFLFKLKSKILLPVGLDTHSPRQPRWRDVHFGLSTSQWYS